MLGDLKSNGVDANLNQYYLFDSLLYTPNTYGFELIKYQVITDSNIINESTICQIKLIVCYLSCKTCSEIQTDTNNENHNCETCKVGYYRKKDDLNNNCYPSDANIDKYYFDSEKGMFMPCDTSCQTCFDKTNYSCITCNTNDKYYPKDPHDYCYHFSYTLNNPFFFDNPGAGTIRPYIYTCNRCTAELNNEIRHHNCTECNNGYSFFEGKITTNCYDSSVDNSSYYYNIPDNTFYKCFTSCETCDNKKDFTSHHCTFCYWESCSKYI